MKKKQSEQKTVTKKHPQKKPDKIDRQIDSTKIQMKKKSGLAKIKNRIQHTVYANKILQLIKKSTLSIPHLLTKQQSKALLPKLQKIVFSQQKINGALKSKAKFQQIQNQLNQSMVLFKKTTQLQRNDLWLIDLQTQKCYKTIPNFYFKQFMTNQEMAKNLILTKKNYQMQQAMMVLGDYLDQVQFNINQQANAKIKMFMNFVMCTNSIQDLITINTSKLNATRKHISLLRDIVVSRSVRINQHRLKKQRLQQSLDALLLFKKLKNIQNKLNTQIALGVYISHESKSKLGGLFNEYCELHNVELKKFCCRTSNNICKYWDITYYVERGFQDNFIKFVKSYMFQIINYPKEIQKYKQAFTINKKSFMTTPTNPSKNKKGQPQFMIMDESFQVEAYEHVQLITRINIQKQIVTLFQQGMHKYSFSTQILQNQLKNYIDSYINKFLKQVLSFNDNQPCISLKNITVAQNKNQLTNYLQSQKCAQKLGKSNWNNFCKIIEMICLRFQYLTIRLFSMIQKLLKKATQLQQQSPQRYQVFSAYMCQLIHLIINITDYYITNILKNKIKDYEKSITIFKSKQEVMKQFDTQCQNMKKLIKFCNKWIIHVLGLKKTYTLSAQQYKKSIIKCNKTLPSQSIWCPNVQQLKSTLAKNTYQLIHRTIISRDLKQKMQEDRWQFIEIKTNIYNDLGYIIGGKQFLIEQQRMHRDSLSKSILMDRSSIQLQLSTHHNKNNKYNKQQYSSKFKINPTYITLGNLKYKIIACTEYLITILRKYLQLYDDIIDKFKQLSLQSKITQLILIYNQYVRDLILKGQAIKLQRIKTKSITAKHLVIAYIQLQIIDVIYCKDILQKRVAFNNQDCLVMHDKIVSTSTEIRKKYQKIIQMRIMDNIDGISIKQEGWFQSQCMQSIPKNIISSIQLFSDLMLNQVEFEKFIDVEPNWAAELVNKVGKGTKGKQYKIKCFTFLDEELKPFYKYLPKLKTAIGSVLN